MRIDEAALDAVPGDDEFAGNGARIRRRGHGFQRFAGKTLSEWIAPGDVETAIGGTEIGNFDADFL
ncbi:hypothetical protein D9M72_631660 [compost metagenome]